MMMRIDVLHRALTRISKFQFPISKQASKPNNQTPNQKIILTTPKGKVFNQQTATRFSKLDHLVIIAGHYEGVDERVLAYVDEEISMGDFVSTGGEITAAAITDATVRLIPNVLKKDEATQLESFFLVSMNQLINT